MVSLYYQPNNKFNIASNLPAQIIKIHQGYVLTLSSEDAYITCKRIMHDVVLDGLCPNCRYSFGNSLIFEDRINHNKDNKKFSP